jgi:hypothetical protein
MISIRFRTARTLLTGLAALGATALITATVDQSPAAAVIAPTVHAASSTLTVTPSQQVRVAVAAHRVHRADRLTVQQYYRKAWHPISSFSVRAAAASLNHTFALGTAPAGRYFVRVVLIRAARRVAATQTVTVHSRDVAPPPPPKPAG